MQEDVRQPVVGNNEPVALGDIKPFDDPGELNDTRRGLVGDLTDGLVPQREACWTLWPQFVRRHDAVRRRLSERLLRTLAPISHRRTERCARDVQQQNACDRLTPTLFTAVLHRFTAPSCAFLPRP